MRKGRPSSTYLATPPRLLRRLADLARRPLGVVVAAGGYGRSALLREYVAGESSAVLLELSTQHTFREAIRDLCETLRDVAPGARLSFPSAYARAAERSRSAPILARWLRHHLEGREVAIVVNRVHRLGPDIATFAEFVEALVRQTGSSVCVLVGSEEDGDLPIPRWLADDLTAPPLRSDELRWTLDEAREAARARGLAAADIIERAHSASQGRFFELLYAIRTGRIAEAGDDPVAIILRELSDDEREFLDRTCLFHGFDAKVTRALGLALQPLLDAERRLERLLVHRVGDTFRYDDRLRRKAETCLGERDALFAKVADASVEALETLGRFGDALRLACSLQASGRPRSLLHRHGVVLEDCGEVEAVDSALTLLDPENDDAVVCLLRATRESRLGRSDAAEAWFRHAIAIAETPRFAAEASYRLARDLVRRDRPDAVTLLEPYLADPALETEQRALIGSLLAQAYLVARRAKDARTAIAAALALTDAVTPVTQAYVFARAAYVELYAGDQENASSYARAAAKIARANNLYVIEFGVYSVLINLSYERFGPSQALPYIEQLWDCAVRIGNLEFQLHAMTDALETFVDRGDCDGIERLDRNLAEFDFYYSGTGSPRDAMLSSRALIAAWAGAFGQAYELLAPSGTDHGDADREALRHAELALYATAAGFREEATIALHAVEEALARVDRCSVYAARAAVTARLAALIAGAAFAAPIDARAADRVVPLANAVDVVARRIDGAASAEDMLAVLDDLWAHDWGGFAKLLAALPLAS